MVLLVVDIGNTNISLGIFDYNDDPGNSDPGEGRASGAGTLAKHWSISTHREQTSDELSVVLSSLFE
ncbi:MAG: type III pantothenate kinase, partial [Deltaproteobacteria bacterium]|nr:type III pantothenate kinase [Deltaproteobacteria bacterium]